MSVSMAVCFRGTDSTGHIVFRVNSLQGAMDYLEAYCLRAHCLRVGCLGAPCPPTVNCLNILVLAQILCFIWFVRLVWFGRLNIVGYTANPSCVCG